VTRRLISTPLTPNQITAASLAVGLLAAACFLPESFAWSLLGWLLFESSYVLDCVDGEIARLKMQESPLGAWIDSMADNVVQAAILFVLSVRLQRSTGHWGFVALGTVGAVGILVTGVTVTHFLVRDKGLRLADAGERWMGSLGLRRLAATLEETANRDPFTLALLAAVLFNRVDLFLWVAALGVYAYLALLLLLKRGTHREAVT
jgi:phosphatidylglycerophosphate synthase